MGKILSTDPNAGSPIKARRKILSTDPNAGDSTDNADFGDVESGASTTGERSYARRALNQAFHATKGAAKAIPDTAINLGRIAAKGMNAIGPMLVPGSGPEGPAAMRRFLAPEAYDAADAAVGESRTGAEQVGRIGGHLALVAAAGQAQAPAALARAALASRGVRAAMRAGQGAGIGAMESGGDPATTALSAGLGLAPTVLGAAGRGVGRVLGNPVGAGGATTAVELARGKSLERSAAEGLAVAGLVKGGKTVGAQAMLKMLPGGKLPGAVLSKIAHAFKRSAIESQSAAMAEKAAAGIALDAAPEAAATVARAAAPAAAKIPTAVAMQEAKKVSEQVVQWQAQGLSRPQMVASIREAYGGAMTPSRAGQIVDDILKAATPKGKILPDGMRAMGTNTGGKLPPKAPPPNADLETLLRLSLANGGG